MQPTPTPAQTSVPASKAPMILLGLGTVGIIAAIIMANQASASAAPTVIITTTTDQTKHGGLGSALPLLFGAYDMPSQENKTGAQVLSLKSILDELQISLA